MSAHTHVYRYPTCLKVDKKQVREHPLYVEKIFWNRVTDSSTAMIIDVLLAGSTDKVYVVKSWYEGNKNNITQVDGQCNNLHNRLPVIKPSVSAIT